MNVHETRPLQHSSYAELLDREASLPKRQLVAKEQVSKTFPSLFFVWCGLNSIHDCG